MTSLSAIKAQNAKDEAAVAPPNEDTLVGADTIAGAEDTLAGGDDTLTGEDTLTGAADDTVDGGDDTVAGADNDDWMKPEGNPDDPRAKFTDKDMGGLRKKMDGRIAKKDTEIETLRKEKEALKKELENKSKPVATTGTPQRDGFETDDDYQAALVVHAVQQENARTANEAQQLANQKRQQAQAEEVEKEVEDHYLRAAELCEKSGIKPERYKEADFNVRSAIAELAGDAADGVVDTLISRVGAGSEKVMYYLDVNPTKRTELLNTLKKDPSGLAAAVYMTRLSERLNAPKAKDTSAPEPQEEVRGDSKPAVKLDKLKKDWETAHAKGDIQGAMTIRRKAAAGGVDTTAWLK